ncbi:MAG TPA: hypothetical protein VFJ13_00385 [Paracoccaceae bacterium]|nr:hypothetical protein [Paracoccaceae bacterium]
MTQRQGTAHFVAGLSLLALAGCGTVGLFGEYDIPESPDVADAPWPKLVDVPEAPPVGVYTEDVPDPGVGIVTQADLGHAASEASARAAALESPVISEAARAEMLARAREAR